MNIFVKMLSDWTQNKPSPKESEEKLRKTVQQHWPDDPIDLECLVREAWEVSEDGKTRKYKYIVFINRKLEIDWITADKSLDKYSDQVCLATALESIPYKHLPKDQILAFKNLIGESIVSFFEGNSESALQLIEKAKQYVMARTVECSRKWILGIATFMILPILFTGLCIWYYISAYIVMPKNFWLISCFWSIIGTYLSIIRKIGQSCLDASAGFKLHFLRVATQILAGALLGIVAYLILSSSVLCPPLFQAFKDSSIGFCLFGFLAGFVEQFIPNIITSLQKEGKQNE